jgi:hypothetical protein
MAVEKIGTTSWAKIFIAGPIDVIEQTCREFCMEGLCVTVTPTKYIYTLGEETGAEIGLINYPRFEAIPDVIFEKACRLAHELMLATHQGSYTVQSSHNGTYYYDRR